MDRNTPGLDETTRGQLIDIDQDGKIKLLLDDDIADDRKMEALVLLLKDLKERTNLLEKNNAILASAISRLQEPKEVPSTSLLENIIKLFKK